MFKKQGVDAFAVRSILMKKGTAIGWKIVRLLALICFSYALIYPFIYMISSTFRGDEDLWNPTVVWITRHFTMDNLKSAWDNMKYGESLPFSLEISVGSALLQSFMCAFAGYAFARFDFKFKGVLFALVILTIIAPQQMYIIQLYGIIKNLNPNGKFNFQSVNPGYGATGSLRSDMLGTYQGTSHTSCESSNLVGFIMQISEIGCVEFVERLRNGTILFEEELR